MAASSHGDVEAKPHRAKARPPEQTGRKPPQSDTSEEETDTDEETETETSSDEEASSEYESTSESEDERKRRAGPAVTRAADNDSSTQRRKATEKAARLPVVAAQPSSSGSDSDTKSDRPKSAEQGSKSEMAPNRPGVSRISSSARREPSADARSDTGSSTEASDIDASAQRPRSASRGSESTDEEASATAGPSKSGADPGSRSRARPPRTTRFSEEIEGDPQSVAAQKRATARHPESRRSASRDSENPSSSDEETARYPPTRPTREARNGSALTTRPSPAARSERSPPTTSPTRARDADSAEKDKNTRPAEVDRDHDHDQVSCWGCCSCGACASCRTCCTSFVRSRFWSWLRRRSAYMVAVVMAGGLMSSGATGVLGFWTFCSIGGYDLGGLGYCQGGTCTIQPFYSLDVPTPSYLPTIVLSALLLCLSGIGAFILLFLLYIWYTASSSCSSGSFTPPHRALLYCCFDPEHRPSEEQARKLERKAQYENGLTEVKWEALPSDERAAMVDEVRMKSAFEQVMWWGGMLGGGVLLGGTIFWKESVNADEGSSYDTLLWGGMATAVMWMFTSQVYRANKRGSVAALLQGEREESRRLRKQAMEEHAKSRAARATGSQSKSAGGSSAQRRRR